MSWTTDGYALAVGYEHGWAVWSVGGRLGGWGMADSEESDVEKEGFMHGVKDLVSLTYQAYCAHAHVQFWAPGNLELFALSSPTANNHQLYVIPFTKSATTSQHSPVSVPTGTPREQAKTRTTPDMPSCKWTTKSWSIVAPISQI